MNKKKLYLGSIFIALLLCCATLFAYQDDKKLYKEDVTSDKAYELIQKSQDALFLDVRTKKEYVHSHAKDSKLIPVFFEKDGKRVFNENFVKQVSLVAEDNLEKPIVLICRSGSRTKFAANLLAKEGFSQVYNIIYGFSTKGGWRDLKLPIEK